MRDRNSAKTPAAQAGKPETTELREVAYDEAAFFGSFYKASARHEVSDRITIGNDFSLMESRFHYNAVENSILRALARRSPPPHGPTVTAAEAMARRRKYRLLDIGSATGHWIDFFRDVVLVTEVEAVEITDFMADHLRTKYAGDAGVRVHKADIAAEDFQIDSLGAPVDYVSAIGVMFHIVDDAKWLVALKTLAAMLKPSGIMFIGGDFGPVTRNAQFHKTDTFESWRDYSKAEGAESEIRVNKRVRSLAAWQDAAHAAGLSIVDLVRTEAAPSISTPENDVLVLMRRDQA